MQVQIL
jgi:hypothetical protein